MKQLEIDKPSSDPTRPTVRTPQSSKEGSKDRQAALSEEYSAIASAIGLIDRSFLTKVRLVGADALDLLQRISTNDLRSLEPGFGVQTVFTTEKGKVIDIGNLYRLRDSSIVLICHAPAERVVAWIQKFIIMEEVTLTDVTSVFSLYSVFGPQSEKALGLIGANHYGIQQPATVIEPKTEAYELIIGEAEPLSPGLDILVPVSSARALWKVLVDASARIGLMPCSLESLEIHRVERGFPAYGKELTEEVNPLEAGLQEFVSFTKGCYIGQEVMARLDTYKKLHKRLMGVVLFERAGTPAPGALVFAKGETIGRITSAVDSILLGRKIALAYIRSAWATANNRVEVNSPSGSIEGRLVNLPFHSSRNEPHV
jgi:folate-binding protein YgfZ